MIVGSRRHFFSDLLTVLGLGESSDEDNVEEAASISVESEESRNSTSSLFEIKRGTPTIRNYLDDDIFLSNFTCKKYSWMVC